MNFDNLTALLLEQFLLEDIQRTDIIDLYIILSMPTIEDPAANFIAQQVVQETSGRILKEAETTVLRELRHMNEESNLRYLYSSMHEYNFSLNETALPNYMSKLGKDLGLPPFSKQTVSQWKALGTALDKARKWLIAQARRKREMTLEELNAATGYRFSYDFIAKLFRKGGWSYEYGGPKWAAIADAVNNLKTSSKKMFVFNLDRLVDLVHNSGSILIKFRTYDRGWLTYLLDLKQHAINIGELIPHASPEVRKLFASQEWRQTKSQMPGGNETAGLERIMWKELTEWYRANRHFAEGFGQIVNLVLQSKSDLVTTFANLYNKSEPKEKARLKTIVRRMVGAMLYEAEEDPKIFDAPSDTWLRRFVRDSDLLYYNDKGRSFDVKLPSREYARYARLVITFIKGACDIVGFNLEKFLKGYRDEYPDEDDERPPKMKFDKLAY
jgi:hypothetical protein